jgi:hypothetical protein
MRAAKATKCALGAVFVAVMAGGAGCSGSSSANAASGVGGAGGSAASGGAAQGGSSTGTGGAGGSAAAGSSSAGAAGYPMTPDGACRASIAAQCETKVRCGLYSDLPTCTIFEELCPDSAFAPGSTRSVSVMFACLETILNASCPEVLAGIVPACLTAGTLADNSPCTYSVQCASGFCGAQSAGGCTSCQHRPGSGEACDNTLGCAPGYYCDRGTNICTAVPTAAPAAEGEACTTVVGCQGLLGCGPTGASTTSVCHVLPGDSQPCPDGLCTPPLVCNLPTANNPICSDPHGCSPPCGTGSYCVNHACVAYAQLGDNCEATDRCAPGLICKAGKCAAQPHLGDPCAEGDCPRVLTCKNGVCAVPDAVPCP